MREDYYADYYEFENSNWWFVSRRYILFALLRKYLPFSEIQRQILDVGCGTGINLAMLSGFGHVRGIDRSEEAIKFCHARNETQVQKACLEELPFEDESFDLITALDVLEHIEDDETSMHEIARVCRPGGYVLISVPVFPWLWCEHDEINHHVRRYRPKRIYELISENNLALVHRSFMNTFLLPIALLWRWRRQFARLISKNPDLARADNMHHHPWINSLLTTIFSSEKPFVTRMGLPVGLSLVVLAQKQPNDF